MDCFRGRFALFVVLAIGGLAAPHAARAADPCTETSPDWCTYGKTANRTFHGVSSLTPYTIQTLVPAWYFATGDAVSANPVVAKGSVYVGSWDGYFYAIDAKTGKQRWSYKMKPQPGVHPPTGKRPHRNGRIPHYLEVLQTNPQAVVDEILTDVTTSGGIETSTAYYLLGNETTGGEDLVIFGGGYTLYALRARDGADFFPPHDYPTTGCSTVKSVHPNQLSLVEVEPMATCPPGDPTVDQGRIFSSPAVVDDRILFSVDSDGQNGHRGYMVAAALETGEPIWIRELDVDASGTIQNDGCGNVWASPTIVGETEVVTVSDCDFKNLDPYYEKVVALDLDKGKVKWIFDPGRDDPDCDWDFGATVNYGTDDLGVPFLGAAGKDGTYYRIDPDDGTLVWRRNLVFGGFSGGFIGSTAFDGQRAYGATALGDFGRFEGFGSLGCMPLATNADGHPDLLIQEPSLHAMDARNGSVVWQGLLSQSFGPTVVANGLVFVGTGTNAQIHIHDAATGIPLKVIQLPASSLSGIIPAGDSIYFGIGSGEQPIPGGVVAMRPIGEKLLDTLPPLPISSLPPLKLPEIPFPSIPLPPLALPDLGVP